MTSAASLHTQAAGGGCGMRKRKSTRKFADCQAQPCLFGELPAETNKARRTRLWRERLQLAPHAKLCSSGASSVWVRGRFYRVNGQTRHKKGWWKRCWPQNAYHSAKLSNQPCAPALAQLCSSATYRGHL